MWALWKLVGGVIICHHLLQTAAKLRRLCVCVSLSLSLLSKSRREWFTVSLWALARTPLTQEIICFESELNSLQDFLSFPGLLLFWCVSHHQWPFFLTTYSTCITLSVILSCSQPLLCCLFHLIASPLSLKLDTLKHPHLWILHMQILSLLTYLRFGCKSVASWMNPCERHVSSKTVRLCSEDESRLTWWKAEGVAVHWITSNVPD